jgi:acyl-CoA thioesterase-1
VTPEAYAKIIARLKQTGAKLIFASTTPVPESDAAKYVKNFELPYNEVAKRVMLEEGVSWNDLWSLVKPRQAELQGKRNVHFMPSGSSVMAKQVAEHIRAALSQPKP